MAKYITWDNGLNDTAIIFSDDTDHAQMAHNLGIHETDLLGAGFVSFIDNKASPYGGSVSLKLGCHENDTFVINSILKTK